MGNGELLFDALGEGCLQHGRYTLPFSFIHDSVAKSPDGTFCSSESEKRGFRFPRTETKRLSPDWKRGAIDARSRR